MATPIFTQAPLSSGPDTINRAFCDVLNEIAGTLAAAREALYAEEPARESCTSYVPGAIALLERAGAAADSAAHAFGGIQVMGEAWLQSPVGGAALAILRQHGKDPKQRVRYVSGADEGAKQ